MTSFPRIVYNPRSTPERYDRGYFTGEFQGIQRALRAVQSQPGGQTVFNIAQYPYFAVPGEASNVAKFNQACQDAKAVHGTVFVPDGHWNPSGGSCVIPLQVDIVGESLAGTIWDGQTYPLNAPLWINEDPTIGLSYSRYANMTLRGGTHGILTTTTGTPQNLAFENFQIQLASVFGFGGNNAWESVQAKNLIVDQCPDATHFDKGAINNWELFAPHFNNCTGTLFDFPAPCTVEGFDCYGFHGENGGNPVKITFNLNAVRSMNFFGYYFEGTSGTLVKETNSVNGLSFWGGHRTGAANGLGGFQPYAWDIKTAGGVACAPQFFGNNSTSFAEDGPTRMFVAGIMSPLIGNNNAVDYARTKQHTHFVSQRTTYSTPIDMIAFTRGGSSTTVADAHALSGTLTVHFYAVDGGSAEIVHSLEYRVFVRANSTGVLTATLSSVNPITVPNGTTFAVSQKAGATATAMTLEGVFTGMPALGVSVLQWEWSDLSSATSADTYITADLP